VMELDDAVMRSGEQMHKEAAHQQDGGEQWGMNMDRAATGTGLGSVRIGFSHLSPSFHTLR